MKLLHLLNVRPLRRSNRHSDDPGAPQAKGQALVEYVLLIVFLVITFGVALSLTGDAIGNVFGNVVWNVVGQDPDLVVDVSTVGGPSAFWATVTWIALNPAPEQTFSSAFTPIVPATATDLPVGFFATQTQSVINTGTAVAAAAITSTSFVTQTAAVTLTAAANQTGTATNAPPATATDAAFPLPHVDQMNTGGDRRWRITNGIVDDVVGTGGPCQWAIVTIDNESNSRQGFFDNDATGNTFASGRTCYMEMRGYLVLGSAALNPEPRLSFWDIWDFTGAGSGTATLQVSNVNLIAGSVDRASLAWFDVPLHTAGTSNYNWTRTEVDLREIPGFTPNAAGQVTVRFKLQGDGGSPYMWNVDDLQVVNDPNPLLQHALNKFWNLDTRAQMDDFIFNTDSERTLERPPLNSAQPSTRRWDLNTTIVRSGTSFHTGTLTRHPGGGPRTYELRIRSPINVSTAPANDFEGDSGNLILSFWHAYDAPNGMRLEVQYTTAAATVLNPTWTTFPTEGLLLNTSGGARTSPLMQRVQINLESIKTTPFRIRFVASVDNQFASLPVANGTGWHIDDIRVERRSASNYHPYPLADGAQDSSYTLQNWVAQGIWGITTEIAGFNASTQSYTDSPGTNYPNDGLDKTFSMTRLIDLQNNTPNKPTGDIEVRPAADNPYLTFWTRRDTSANVALYVDLWIDRTATWTAVWSYNSNTAGVRQTNNQWERVEIDLREAVIRANGVGWTWAGAGPLSVLNNPCDAGANLLGCKDDDIKVRFRMVAQTSATSLPRGFHVDQIAIGELAAFEHKLWAVGSGGNGETYNDLAETNLTDNWFLGAWKDTTLSTYATCPFMFQHQSESLGARVLHDSIGLNCPTNDSLGGLTSYSDKTLNILEMRRVLDLTSTPGGSLPILYFWSRRAVGNGDEVRVEISTYNSGDTAVQAYNDPAYWNPWAVAWTRPEARIDTWQREQINLTPYIGLKIRVRFVVDVPDTASQSDGWYIDGIRATTQRNAINLDLATSALPSTWVREGRWGTSSEFFQTNTSATLTEFTGWLWSVHNLSGTTFGSVLRADFPIDTVSVFAGNNPPYTGAPADNFAQRFRKTNVLMSPGTYTFSAISDDGVRVYFDNNAGTNLGTTCAGAEVVGNYCLIERWIGQGPTLSARTIIVSTTSPRTVTVDNYDSGGGSVIAMNVTRDGYSFSDSPGSGTIAATGDAYAFVNSVYYGNSTLTLNGYINTNALAGTQYLQYEQLYVLNTGTQFLSEYSTDGGFTWTAFTGTTLNGSTVYIPVNMAGNTFDFGTGVGGLSTWQQVGSITAIPVPEANELMIRFRLNTLSSGTATGDGVYISNIIIQ